MSYNPDPKTWRWAPCETHIGSKEKNLPCMEARDPTGVRVPDKVVFEALQAALNPTTWQVPSVRFDADEADYRKWLFIQGGWPQKEDGGPVSPAGVLKGFHDVSDELRKLRRAVRPLYAVTDVEPAADEEIAVNEVLALLERYDDVAKAVKNEDAVAADIADRVMQFVSKDIEKLAETFYAKRRALEEQVEKLQKEGQGQIEKLTDELAKLEEQHKKALQDVAARDALIESMSRSRQLDMASIREFLTKQPFPGMHVTKDGQCEGCDDCAPRHEGCRDFWGQPCRYRWVEKTATASAFWRSDCGTTMSTQAMMDLHKAAREKAARPKPMSLDEVSAAMPWQKCEVTLQGHTITVKATGQIGMNTGRACWQVDCKTCGTQLHENTTGPVHYIYRHLREALEAP